MNAQTTPSIESTELALKLWVVLSRAFESVAKLDRASIESHGLTQGEFSVLEALYHKGPLLLGEIGRSVLISSGGTTYLVDRLEGKGLVQRRACAEDRRATYAELTAEGRGLMDCVFPVHAETLARALGALDSREKEVATDLLRKLGLEAARQLDGTVR